MIIVYGLKNCDRCRSALSWLKENKISFEFFDIKSNPPSENQIKNWINVHTINKILNKKSTTWRQLSQNLKENIDSNIEKTLLEFPTLIKRPIWEVNSKAINHLIPGFLDDHKKYLKNLNK